MSYADEGVGAPVLLIHGWAAHGGFFQDLAARLARTRRVLTLTLRGHLGSEPGQAPLTIETLGEDIAEFVEARELKAVTALGWSMGAMALWAAAARLGDRLEAIIVEEMAPLEKELDGASDDKVEPLAKKIEEIGKKADAVREAIDKLDD
ncbi:MAG TPA: alpha/beta fold hydrolase, partial [Terricaulis sp.]|nr:alpha/beta fold hydrolase [Terricaulis sp.]